MVTAPHCTKLLADMGSEVIKIEQPGLGDPARRQGPFPDDTPHLERSGLFLYLNTNKLGVTLNLKVADGQSLLARLIKDADVVVENIPPDERATMGLDYESLRDANPSLIMLSVTPFGLSGPCQQYKGNYLTAFHGGGYGYDYPKPADDPDTEPPLRGGGRAADFITAITACIALMQAVIGRGANGLGSHIDLSQQEAIAYTQYGPLNQYNKGEPFSRAKADFKPGFVTAVLPCQDGYVAVSPREEHQWARWLEVMGSPDWAKDERFKDVPSRTRHWDEIVARMGKWSRLQRKDAVYRAAQENRVVSYPFNTMADLVSNPQLAHRQYYTKVDHPVIGKLMMPGLPFISTAMPKQSPRPAPLLGQHNEEIYCERLGYAKEDLVRLRELGVI
jgi:crotonobetainyl-CoA:carnitine CoA-transferase CaiB-like acyl-CoA transferase